MTSRDLRRCRTVAAQWPIMDVALFGHAENDPGDPRTIVPPSLADAHLIDGPISKHRREDLQVWSWLTALALRDDLEHPVSVAAGADPPDRLLTVGHHTHRLELTELTLQTLRSRLSRVRRVGRGLQEVLNLGGYEHLHGRFVSLQDVSPTESGDVSDADAIVEQMASRLREDKGFVGEGLEGHDYSIGMPEQIPNRGMYGEVDNVVIQANLSTPGSVVEVQASAQCDFSLSEARSLLWSRVLAKDQATNGVLLLTTGLVDSSGYVCPIDQWLFHCLQQHGVGVPPTDLQHLDAIALHHFGSSDWLVVYRRQEASTPWRASGATGA